MKKEKKNNSLILFTVIKIHFLICFSKVTRYYFFPFFGFYQLSG